MPWKFLPKHEQFYVTVYSMGMIPLTFPIIAWTIRTFWDSKGPDFYYFNRLPVIVLYRDLNCIQFWCILIFFLTCIILKNVWTVSCKNEKRTSPPIACMVSWNSTTYFTRYCMKPLGHCGRSFCYKLSLLDNCVCVCVFSRWHIYSICKS
jgi:hypothetical protein